MNARPCFAVLLLAAVLLAPAADPSARTWEIKKDGLGDFTVIQDGVDVAAPGDTILIHPGRYEEAEVYPYDNESASGLTYVGIETDSLTIRGTDRDTVIIGPTEAAFQGFNPKGITTRLGYITHITIQDLTVENVREGLRLEGRSQVNDVKAVGCDIGILAFRGQTTIEMCEVAQAQNDGILLVETTSGMISRTNISGATVFATAVVVLAQSDVTIRGSMMGGMGQGMTVAGGSRVAIFDSEIAPAIVSGIHLFDSSLLEIHESTIGPGAISLSISPGCTAMGTGNRFLANEEVTISMTANAASVVLSNNRIAVPANTLAVDVDGTNTSGTDVFFDLRNNYWDGVTDPDSLAALIDDGYDNPGMNAYVLFDPPRGNPIPTATSSFGNLKSRYGPGPKREP